MRTFRLLKLVIFGLLPFAVSCVHTNPAVEGETKANPNKGLVFIAFVNDSDLLLTTRTIEVILLYKGIHPYVEGSGAGDSVSVKRCDARAATRLIAENLELRGHGVWINKAFLSIEIKGASEVRMGKEPWLDLSTAQE